MQRSVAIVTPTYRGDLERCRLLCESIDKHVSGFDTHLLLVDNEDFALFKSFQQPRRIVVNELDLLPAWLHTFRPPLIGGGRKLWWSTKTWPMRGWHVQQLRRIAIAAHVDQQALLYCDSDMMFVRAFDVANLWRGNDLRLYRKAFGIDGNLAEPGALHRQWTEQAARLFRLPTPEFPAHDYINNLVSWRREDVQSMCRRIENISAKHWVAAIASARTFSECQIYGRYVDVVQDGDGHWHAPKGLCETVWCEEELGPQTLLAKVENLQAEQVAVGVQSFIDIDIGQLRKLI